MPIPIFPSAFIDKMRAQKESEGKKPPHGLWAFLGAFLALMFGNAVGGLVFFLFGGTMAEGQAMPTPMFSFFLLATTGFPLIFGVLWILFFERRSLKSFGLNINLTGLMRIARGFLLGVLAMGFGVYFLSALDMATLSAPTFPAGWAGLWPLALLIIAWLVQGTSEEVLLRGILFQSIAARHGLVAGLIISSLLFSLLHGLNPNTTPLFFVNLIVYSLFACIYVLREQSLWGIAGFHGAWNFAQGHLFGIPISGADMAADQVIHVTPTGPELITGGAAGLEGGLAATLALIVSAGVVLLLTRGDQKGTSETATQ